MKNNAKTNKQKKPMRVVCSACDCQDKGVISHPYIREKGIKPIKLTRTSPNKTVIHVSDKSETRYYFLGDQNKCHVTMTS